MGKPGCNVQMSPARTGEVNQDVGANPLEMIILQTLPYESEYMVFPKSSQNLMVCISLYIGMSHHILIIFSHY